MEGKGGNVRRVKRERKGGRKSRERGLERRKMEGDSFV